MGSYALIAGLYQLQTGERLKLLDADNQAIADHVKLTKIEVPTAAHVAAGEAP
jgi:hypothetical protein